MVAALTVKALLYASSLFLSFSGASAAWDATSKNNVVVYYVSKTILVQKSRQRFILSLQTYTNKK